MHRPPACLPTLQTGAPPLLSPAATRNQHPHGPHAGWPERPEHLCTPRRRLRGQPHVTWLDVLGEEDPAAPPPSWRAPKWTLPDGEEDPTIWVPDHEPYGGVPRGSLPPVSKLPDTWGPIGPMHHCPHPYHPPLVHLRLAGGGRGVGHGDRLRRPWPRVGGFFLPQQGHDRGGAREADGSLSNV